MLLCKLSLIVLLTCNLFAIPEKPEGWMWYSPIQKIKIKKEKNQVKKKAPLTQRQKIEKLKDLFEEETANAIFHPSLENVQNVMRLQNAMVERSQEFANMWMLASLIEKAPSENANSAHLRISREQAEKRLEQNIKSLAKTHGLFFMFKSFCPFCHEFAPVVKSFAKNYGFEIKAISYDGAIIRDFPNASRDNGWVDQLNPDHIFPCLFLVNPTTKDVMPLAKGMTSFNALKDNCQTIINYLIGGQNG